MSNFHFDLSLKLSQGEVHDFSGEVHDFSGEVQKFSGEVQNDLRGSAHLPSKSDLGIIAEEVREPWCKATSVV